MVFPDSSVVSGLDTPSRPVGNFTQPPPNVDFRDVDFDQYGDIAVAVGLGGEVWRFESGSESWFDLDGSLTITEDLHGVDYDESTGKFIIVGDGATSTISAYTTDGFSNPVGIAAGADPALEFYDVAVDSNTGEFVAVGPDNAYWHDGATWNSLSSMSGVGTYYSVDYSNYYSKYYVVGEDTGFNGVLWEVSAGVANGPLTGPNYYGGTWDNMPLFGVACNDIGDTLIVGDHTVDLYYAGNFYNASNVDSHDKLHDVLWGGSEEALIVGNNTMGGVLYKYGYESKRVSELPGSPDITNDLYAVSGRDGTPRYAMAIGDFGSDSAYKISQTSGFNDIKTKTKIPHILEMGLYKNPDPNDPLNQRLNSQIDVNSNDFISTSYRLYVQVYHAEPGQLRLVNISAWYDNGLTGINSNYPVADQWNQTRAFSFGFDYDNAGNEFQWNYPKLTAEGQELVPDYPACNYNYKAAADGDYLHVNFSFAPGPQARHADGESGFFGIEGNNNPHPNQWDKSAALNTPYTWDINVTATGRSSGQNTTFDEFGFYRYTELTVWGLPGSFSGAGAPGQTIGLNRVGGTPMGNVVFSANCNYSLKMYAETDLEGQNTTDFIPATNIEIAGGENNSFLPGFGEANSMYLLEKWMAPRNRGNQTDTSINTTSTSDPKYQENLTAFGSIQIWVTIPIGIEEDSYSTSLVYVLEHDG
ncbi:MAG: hypothetical protein ACQESD_03740 [Thermoplasmatota archaeon]